MNVYELQFDTNRLSQTLTHYDLPRTNVDRQRPNVLRNAPVYRRLKAECVAMLLVDQAMQIPEFDIIKTSSDVTKSRRLPRSNCMAIWPECQLLRMLDLHYERWWILCRAPYYHHEQQRRFFKRTIKKGYLRVREVLIHLIISNKVVENISWSSISEDLAKTKYGCNDVVMK